MIAPPGTAARRRLIVWAVGTVLALAVFGARRLVSGISYPAGRARRLLSINADEPVLTESPDGGRWLLAISAGNLSAPPSGAGFDWQSFRRICWATWSRRGVQPLQPEGSYLLTGDGLRRESGLAADGWLDRDHFYSVNRSGDGEMLPIAIDLQSHRERPVPIRRVPHSRGFDTSLRDSPSLKPLSNEYPFYQSGELRSPEAPQLSAPGADGWPTSNDDHLKWGQVGSRKVILADAESPSEGKPGLYALSDTPAPRALYLMPSGEPTALSRDGRTLFVVSRHTLWRLDLRKPLPALLDEHPAPDLREPAL